jgi:Tol biopolymer transport system component
MVLRVLLALGAAALHVDAAKDVILINQIRPAGSELYVASADGATQRKLFPISGFDYHASFSTDGKWIAFSSDRQTQWKGHPGGIGFEHVQEASIYVIRPNGTGLQRITKEGTYAGSPKWSLDGKRLVFYEMAVAETYAAHIPSGFLPPVTSQIVSVDVETGARTVHTSGPGLKVAPQYLPNSSIAYLIKAGENAGLAYTDRPLSGTAGQMRSPSWSLDGKQVVYENLDWTSPSQNQILYSWDPQYEYRFTDIFPAVSKDGKLVVSDSEGKLVNPQAPIAIMDADGSNKKVLFQDKTGMAFAAAWSPDGEWIAFGFGGFFKARSTRPAKIVMIRSDGSGARDLTGGTSNAGFPSWSPDGKKIVYRVWGANESGLRVLDLASKSIKTLTTGSDNFPAWSPSGDRIAFTRNQDGEYDLFVVRPDGTELKRLTNSPGNDAHGAWSPDGKFLLWSSSRSGFKDEAPLYDNSPQPYSEIFIMNADGSSQRSLTDNRYEDAMPVFVPKRAPTHVRR